MMTSGRAGRRCSGWRGGVCSCCGGAEWQDEQGQQDDEQPHAGAVAEVMAILAGPAAARSSEEERPVAAGAHPAQEEPRQPGPKRAYSVGLRGRLVR